MNDPFMIAFQIPWSIYSMKVFMRIFQNWLFTPLNIRDLCIDAPSTKGGLFSDIQKGLRIKLN